MLIILDYIEKGEQSNLFLFNDLNYSLLPLLWYLLGVTLKVSRSVGFVLGMLKTLLSKLVVVKLNCGLGTSMG